MTPRGQLRRAELWRRVALSQLASREKILVHMRTDIVVAALFGVHVRRDRGQQRPRVEIFGGPAATGVRPLLGRNARSATPPVVMAQLHRRDLDRR
jgi:hypothetical protein